MRHDNILGFIAADIKGKLEMFLNWIKDCLEYKFVSWKNELWDSEKLALWELLTFKLGCFYFQFCYIITKIYELKRVKESKSCELRKSNAQQSWVACHNAV